MSSILETYAQTGDSLAELWGHIDQIYCISLTQRADRRQNAQREFDRIGLKGRVQFVLVESHPTDSEQGIFESHIACLRAGLAAGAQNILIFEDDVIFRRFSPRILARAIRFMKSNADWQIFFFGCFVWSSRETPFESVLRARYRCTAHAYVVSRRFAENLAELRWREVAYDDLLSNMNGQHFYVCYPAFAFQSGSTTDNNKLRGIDRARRLVGGLYRLQRWNEFSSRHLRTLILLHVVIGLLIACMMLLHWFVH